MRTAASTVKSSFPRLCRWLYAKAIALSLALVLLACWVAGNPPEAGAAPARPTVSHAPVGRAAAARPLLLGSGQFGGLTSKGWPVVVKVSRRGDRVKQAVAGVELNCTAGGSFAINDMWKDLPIRRRRFSARGEGADSEGGFVFAFTDSVSGRMNRKGNRISGTWRSVMVQRNAVGAVMDTCDTGPLRFTVRR